ncbi:apolipoprotein N-acyltransferase [PVC group bacterium]|nr:apolipoprotein N-acyltransferase [PVC group bacterium]
MLWSIVFGFLTALSFPPYDCHFLVWFSFAFPIYLIHKNKSINYSFRFGYLFGLAFYAVLLSWIIEVSWWGLVLILILPVFYGFIFSAVCIWLKYFLSDQKNGVWEVLFAVPVIWVFVEHLREYVLTGFPWGQIGYSQYLNPSVIQLSSVLGVYGVSAWIVFVNICLMVGFSSLWKTRRWTNKVTKVLLAAGCVSLLLVFFGKSRIGSIDLDRKETIKIGIVQGNIPLDEKWDISKKDAILEKYIVLSKELIREDVKVVVWPESALPFYYRSDENRKKRLNDFVKNHPVTLITGALDRRLMGDTMRYFNSVFVLSADREALVYDKIHLVPFGEYVPSWIKKIFPQIHKRVTPGEDFSAGKVSPALFVNGKFSLGPLICYEDVFPELSRKLVKNGASALLNLTNDAWFGNTAMSYQHLMHAVFRAAENGVYVLRAANTGISCVIDPYGRVIRVIQKDKREPFFQRSNELFVTGILSADVSSGLGTTVYQKVGVWPWVVLYIALVFVGYYRSKRMKNQG